MEVWQCLRTWLGEHTPSVPVVMNGYGDRFWAVSAIKYADN